MCKFGAYSTKDKIESRRMWYARMCHPGEKVIDKLLKHKRVADADDASNKTVTNYSTCVYGKTTHRFIRKDKRKILMQR